jgi:hypothetical protein
MYNEGVMCGRPGRPVTKRIWLPTTGVTNLMREAIR